MSLQEKVYSFVQDLRAAGIAVSPDELGYCYQALLLVDWTVEDGFYTALFATLVKDVSHAVLFDQCYHRHFRGGPGPGEEDAFRRQVAEHLAQAWQGEGAGGAGRSCVGEGEAGQGEGAEGRNEKAGERERDDASGRSDRLKNLAAKDFRYLSVAEMKALENLMPLVARRLASRMIKKRKKNRHGGLDFRQTFRHSLAAGGAPLELITRPKIRQKPIIFALCDVSASVWEFSNFSLGLVYSLERFFREVRSFAFVDEIDEITSLLRRIRPEQLRRTVFNSARVVNDGRTDYGHCLKSFLQRYGAELSPRSYLLIFGDARNNWYSSESRALAALKGKVKRVYWFNPEPQDRWDSGDSVISAYAAHCDRAFACSNLRALADAFTRI
jgi:uncharacterized protein with von Willebrand factor type A (vWA) domain